MILRSDKNEHINLHRNQTNSLKMISDRDKYEAHHRITFRAGAGCYLYWRRRWRWVEVNFFSWVEMKYQNSWKVNITSPFLVNMFSGTFKYFEEKKYFFFHFETSQVGHVSQILVHPLKCGRAEEVDRVQCGPRGPWWVPFFITRGRLFYSSCILYWFALLCGVKLLILLTL